MGCLVKANALVSGNRQHRRYVTVYLIVLFNSNIVFTKQPSAERYLEKKFRQYFYKLLGNSCSASKKRYLEIFRKFAENTRGEFYFSKVTGFYRSSQRRCSVKKGDLRKVFAKFTGKHLWQRLYFNKIAGLRL